MYNESTEVPGSCVVAGMAPAGCSQPTWYQIFSDLCLHSCSFFSLIVPVKVPEQSCVALQ